MGWNNPDKNNNINNRYKYIVFIYFSADYSYKKKTKKKHSPAQYTYVLYPISTKMKMTKKLVV